MPDIQTLSTDGHRFTIRLLAQKDRRAPLVVICPAMGVQGKYYSALADLLHAGGLQAALFDLRGQGSSSLRASRAVNWGYADMVEQDFPALLDALHTEAPLAPVFFWGHSQGGQLACLFMAANPDAAQGAVLVACGSVYFRCWPFPQNLKILVQTQILRLSGLVAGYMPGDKLGFAGRQARNEISDWADCALNGRYDLRNTKTDYEAALKTLAKPVWAFSLEGDDYAPRAATGFLLGKMPAGMTRHQHMTAADMPAKALHHFYWAKQAEGLVQRALPLIRGEWF
jgi:predicted alpha/beta hydrolase